MNDKVPKVVNKIMLAIILFLSTCYLVYNILLLKIVTSSIKTIVIIFILVISILFLIRILKKQIKFGRSVLVMSYALLLILSSSFTNNIRSKLQKMSVSYSIKSMSIVKLKEDKNESNTIGILNNDIDSFNNINDITGELVIKNSYNELIDELYSGNLQYIYIPSNYISSMDNYSDIVNDIEIVYTNYEKQKMEIPNIDMSKTPFTILVMGVDSSEDSMINSSFNGDALILITFNPTNLKATILSIPRDTYTNITCFDGERKNKITHAAWYGESCMIDTINKLFNINIDYFVKINFKGFVSLIDSVGGIDINVPITFCEQDSNRSFENEICLTEGLNHLNGEQVLALARHRKTINDFIRGDNQKIIVESLIEKIKSIKKIDKLYSILDTISNNMVTNVATENMNSIYNIFTKGQIELIKLKLEGYGEYIYDYSALNNQGMKMSLYNFVPYAESIQNISNAMKQNLNGEEIVINSNSDYSSNLILLPNFVGRTVEEVESFCNKYNINLNINEIVSHNSMDYEGKVINQDMISGMDAEYVDSLTIDVVSKVEKIDNTINCSKEENKDNSLCQIPNFIGKNYNIFKEWINKNKYSFRVSEKIIKKKDKNYDTGKKGQIISQNYYGSIYDIIGKTLKIEYIEN